MLPANPAGDLYAVPLTILVPDLLKQFNKPTLFGRVDVQLSKAQMDAIGGAVADGTLLPDVVPALIAALHDITAESVRELRERFDLSFREALQTTDMSELGGWETTAEFLEIANIKSNAELRISAGSSLAVFLGDATLTDHLLTVIEVDAGTEDVDAVIAKRALAQLTGIPVTAEDWLAQVRSTIATEG